MAGGFVATRVGIRLKPLSRRSAICALRAATEVAPKIVPITRLLPRLAEAHRLKPEATV